MSDNKQNLIIEELKAVFDKENKITVCTAIINSKLHYTGDIRNIGPNWYAVFSDITEYDDKINSGVKLCIEKGIYTQLSIGKLSVHQDHYIWVKLNIELTENKKHIS